MKVEWKLFDDDRPILCY